MSVYEDLTKAIEQTFVAKFPRQKLATFGITIIDYYVVTEPLYTATDFAKKDLESVVRKGKVIAQKPTIITPTYALNLDGFSDGAYDYMRHISRVYGPNSPAVMYEYKNQPISLEIVGGIPTEIAHRISEDLIDHKNDLSVVIVGVDEFWDASLMKFIYEFTGSSLEYNAREMRGQGFLDPQKEVGGIPKVVLDQIEEMFKSVQKGGSPHILKTELDKWGVYKFYEDRFLSLFK
jgi:hypothetical protein